MLNTLWTGCLKELRVWLPLLTAKQSIKIEADWFPRSLREPCIAICIYIYQEYSEDWMKIGLSLNILKNLPIIPSQTSQIFYPLFFFIPIAPPIIPF